MVRREISQRYCVKILSVAYPNLEKSQGMWPELGVPFLRDTACSMCGKVGLILNMSVAGGRSQKISMQSTMRSQEKESPLGFLSVSLFTSPHASLFTILQSISGRLMLSS